jgi:hypothetical protein
VNRFLSFAAPVLAVPVLALFAACSGAVLPIAQNDTTGMDGGGSASTDGGGKSSDDASSSDGGAAKDAASSGEAGVSGCVPACKPNEVCARDQVLGGAFIAPDDAGACPPGRHPVADHCENDPTFACVPYPAACASALVFDCSCAASVCTSQSSCPYQCQSATETQVDCICPVP